MDVKTIILINDYCEIKDKLDILESEIKLDFNNQILKKQHCFMNGYKSTLYERLKYEGLSDKEINNLKVIK